VFVSGRYLYLGARLPEPSGRFTTRSIGKKPHWEEEDALTFIIRIANENDWMLQVGPAGGLLGAMEDRRTGLVYQPGRKNAAGPW